jgi:hypothetical protein
MGPAIPAVKIPDCADPLSIRRPNGKTHASMSIDLHEVSSELFVDLIVVPHTIQLSIQFTQNWSVRVGVADLKNLS